MSDPLRDEDHQALVDEISRLLRTPATLEARDFSLIAFASHSGLDETVVDPVRTRTILGRSSPAEVRRWFEGFGITRATGPVRIPADPAAGVTTGRICLPARRRGVVHGYVWLLDDGSLSPEDPRMPEAMAIAGRIGASLGARIRPGARPAEALRRLLTAPPAARPGAVAAVTGALGSAAGGPVALVAVLPWPVDTDPGDPTPPVLAATVLPGPANGPRPPETPAAGTRPALALLVRLRERRGDPEPPPGPAREVAEAALARLPAPGRGTARAGIALCRGVPTGDPTGADSPNRASEGAPDGRGIGTGTEPVGPAGWPLAWRRATTAAGVAAAEPRTGRIAEWSALGAHRLLTSLPPGPPDPAVRVLLRPAHRELARTAEVWLDLAGRAGETARELGIHRQTLYYRLARVEELTGLRVADGGDRLLLHMALKAARLHGTG
ncbi:helix-turn-helix domain-containing protein [Streptomyces sp. ST2-7A]|uniref:helix-turn-helix domain-containing protein n=1 Tax=Streptomyces sp. ST2-7A TaxID=2907214 RepID=UPI001F391588|nr:helix-turn-helix domain-containing protein [Streptomyces sp. ST2-7A]MCE7083229.1 helix-turn-helix domain-containing protein [Streptomyces sp. ST2-7A]